ATTSRTSAPATRSSCTSRSSRAPRNASRCSRVWSSAGRAAESARPSPCARRATASASSAPSRCTRPTSPRSRSSPAVTSVAPSCTTCAICVARRPRSRRSAEGSPPCGARVDVCTAVEEITAGYADPVTGSTASDDAEHPPGLDSDTEQAADESAEPKRKHGALREGVILVSIALVMYYVMLTFVARPYLIPSESMQPTLHGCPGCVGDRIMVDKLTYRFSDPQPGDVVVFKGPPNWNIGYQSIRSDNTRSEERR